MADKRISVLDVATVTAGWFVPLDKPGATEAVRVALSLLLPTSIYRCNEETVASGEVTITFIEAFPAGTDYAIISIWGLDTEGSIMNAQPYDKTITGFKINFAVAGTFTYLAIIKR